MNLPSSSDNNNVENLSQHNLQDKINLVQEILTRLELLLKAVSNRCRTMEDRFNAEFGSIEGVSQHNTVPRPHILNTLKEWEKMIEKIITEYCAFENILRTVEENRQIEGNVRLLIPDLTRLDILTDTLHSVQAKMDWKSLKQKVIEHNSEPKRAVPVVSHFIQIRYEPSTDDPNTQQSESNHTSSHLTSVGKRTLNAETSLNPPTKVMRISYRKDDVVAATAVRNSPLNIVRSLCGHTNGKNIVEVIAVRETEENRLLPQSDNHGVTGPSNVPRGSNNNYNYSHTCSSTNYINNHSSQTVSTMNTYYPQNPIEMPSCSRNINYDYQAPDRGLYSKNQNTYGGTVTCNDGGLVQNYMNINNTNFRSINQSDNHSNPLLNNSCSNVHYQTQPTFNNVVNVAYLSNSTNPNHVNSYSLSQTSNATQPNNVSQQTQPSVSNSHDQYYNSNPQYPVLKNNINCSARRSSCTDSPYFNSSSAQPSTSANTNSNYGNYNMPAGFNNNTRLNVTNDTESSTSVLALSPDLHNNDEQIQVVQQQDDEVEIINEINLNPNLRNSEVPTCPVEDPNTAPAFATSSSVKNRFNNRTRRFSSYLKELIAEKIERKRENNSVRSSTTTNIRNNKENLNVLPERPTVIQKSLSSSSPHSSGFKTADALNNSATPSVKNLLDLLIQEEYSLSTDTPLVPGAIENERLNTDAEVPEDDTFESLKIKDKVLEGIKSWNYLKPWPMQMEGIKAMMNGKDIICRSKFSGGKTSLAMVGILATTDSQVHSTQAIIVTTKEQSLHIQTKISSVSAVTDVKSVCADDYNDLSAKSTSGHILVGSPENVLLMLQKTNFRTSTVKTLVIDPADKLLQNSTNTLIRILYALSGSTQVVMLCTVKTDAVLTFSRRLRSPQYIESQDVECDNENIREILNRPTIDHCSSKSNRVDNTSNVSAPSSSSTSNVENIREILNRPTIDHYGSKSNRVDNTSNVPAPSSSSRSNVENIREILNRPTVDRYSSKSNNVNNTSNVSAPSSSSTINDPSSVVQPNQKLKYRVKSMNCDLVEVDVTAVNAYGEKADITEEEEDDEEEDNGVHRDKPIVDISHWMDFDDNIPDPEEDPLAISEEEEINSVEEIDPQEFARRTKTQAVLQKNPHFVVAFPEDIRKMLEDLSKKAELADNSDHSEKSEVVAPTEETNNNAMINREDFLTKKHFHVVMEDDDERVCTLSLLNMEQEKTIIFCNTIERAEWLCVKLRQNSMLPQVLHEKVKKKDRETILKSFFEMGFSRILIATDFLVEISKSGNVPLVINYDMPIPPSAYVWRSRYANWKSDSVVTMVVSFITENSLEDIKKIEEMYGISITSMMDDNDIPEPTEAESYNHDTIMDMENPD